MGPCESGLTARGGMSTKALDTLRERRNGNGLTPYKAYWFSVQALGSEGAGAMSVPSIGRAA